MYSLIYRFYFSLKRKVKKLHLRGKNESRMIQRLLDYCQWFFNIPLAGWYHKHPSHKSGVTEKKRKQKVVVSLTTYPKRIGTVWLTVETLMRQTVKPDEIILWLADSQFEAGRNGLPENLLRLQNRGLTIRFCDDLRSHKKYYYALQEYAQDLVILADDDMFYPRDTIKKLLQLHKKYPDDICSMTAQVIGPDFTVVPSNWRNPRLNEKLQHSDALHRDAFCKPVFQEICCYADDLWIAFQAARKGTKVTTLKKWRPFPICIYGTAEDSLYYINGEGKQNDVQWQNLLNYYGINNQ